MVEVVLVYFPVGAVGFIFGFVAGMKALDLRVRSGGQEWSDYQASEAPMADDFYDWEIEMNHPDDDGMTKC